MKVLSTTAHGVLDYVIVAAFAVAPSIFDLSGGATAVSYVLAIVHLLMTLGTDFSAGLVSGVSLKLHAAVELFVGLALALGSFGLGVWVQDVTTNDTTFFFFMGVAILVHFTVTDFGTQRTPHPG